MFRRTITRRGPGLLGGATFGGIPSRAMSGTARGAASELQKPQPTRETHLDQAWSSEVSAPSGMEPATKAAGSPSGAQLSQLVRLARLAAHGLLPTKRVKT